MQNQATAQPSPDFKDASTQPKKRLGYNGEITDAIENNDLLSTATDRHHANRKFKNKPTVHEGNHVVLGLLEETHPELMEGKSYQEDDWAECYVAGMQNYIEGITTNRSEFIDNVLEEVNGAFHENQCRVLAWLLAPFSDKTLSEISEEGPLSLSELMASEGISMVRDDSNGQKEKIVIITSSQYGEFTVSKSGIEFPSDFPGRDMIAPFAVTSVTEAGAMFDALEPAMKLLRAKGKTDPTAPSGTLSDITVGEIIGLLRGGASSDLGKNVVRGMDVKPA